MTTTQSPVTFLIGEQCTTGMTHLTTTSGKPRCGISRATRYKLSIWEERGTLESIKCKRCREIAQKQIKSASV